nr:actin cytoskeleton-regulatory complex protein PAN1-like [Aegilops tauschii subsp. strangulata]
MPKRTMGGRADAGADAGADAMAHEPSKHRAKLHMEKLLPAGKGSSRQQGGLDVVDHVQAPVQVSLTLEQVAPPPEQVTPLPRHLPPLPRHLPPLPQPVVNIDGDDDEEEVTALAPQTEQVSPLPRVTPPVPEPVVVGDVNKEDISHLSPLIVAPLASLPEQVVDPHPQPGVRLPWLLPPLPPPVVVADENEEEVMKGDLSSTINYAVGTSQGSIKNGYAFRVKHAAYADYLRRLL